MRITGFVCLLVALTRVAPARELSLRDLAWLAGDWQVTSNNRTVEEHWTAPSTNMLVGMSRTIRDDRTTAFEFLRIEQRDNGIFYIAQPNGRPGTDFKLTSGGNIELVFEGDGTDRVRRITYRHEGSDGLHAVVEGQENGRPFTLEYRYRRPGPVVRPATH